MNKPEWREIWEKETSVHPAGSCFLWHDWTKWKEYVHPIITNLGEAVEYRQRRSCLRCGKIQVERILE